MKHHPCRNCMTMPQGANYHDEPCKSCNLPREFSDAIDKTDIWTEDMKDRKVKEVATEIVSSTEGLNSIEALITLKRLVGNVCKNNFKIGGVLSVIKRNDYWKTYVRPNGMGTYTSFVLFVYETCGIKPRAYQEAIKVYESIREKNIPFDAVCEVHWSKLKKMVKYLTSENVTEYVDAAKNMNNPTFESYLCKHTPKNNPTPPKIKILHKISFVMSSEQQRSINSTLEKVMAKRSISKIEALIYICRQYDNFINDILE